MSQDPHRKRGSAIFNPYKRHEADLISGGRAGIYQTQSAAGVRQATIDATPGTIGMTLGIRSTTDTPADEALFGKAARSVNHRHMNSEHFESLSGGDKKVFKFQMDPGFRNDLMKKRMSSKISFKDISKDDKRDHPRKEGTISGAMTALQMKRQSLDFMRMAEEKEQHEVGEKSKATKASSIRVANFMDCLPNKQAIFGMLDHQKTINMNKLKERKTAREETVQDFGVKGVTIDSRSAKFSKAMRFDSKVLNLELKRGPINIARDQHVEPRQTVGDEDETLLDIAEKEPKRGGSELGESTKQSRAVHLDNFFSKKKNNSAAIDIAGSNRHDQLSNSVDMRRQRSQSREVHEVKTQTYYMVALKYNYKKKVIGSLAMVYREHFIQSVGAIKYLLSKNNDLYKYSDVDFIKGKLKFKNKSMSAFEFLTKSFTGEPSSLFLTRTRKAHSSV